MKINGLIGSATVYAMSSLVTSAIPFLLLPILTRVLTPSDYGVVAMFGIWLSIMGVFTGLSTQGAIGVRYFEYDKKIMQVYVSTCVVVLIASTIIALGCVILLNTSLEKYISVPGNWLVLGVTLSGLQFVILLRLSLWQVSKQPWKYAQLQISQSAINACFSLWLVLMVGLAWEGRLIGISIATLIIALVSLISLWREGWLPMEININDAKNALKFGLPLIPHVLGGMLLATIDRVMVANMLGISQAGIYTVAVQVGTILSLITVSINQAYAPWLFEQLKLLNENNKCRIVRYTYIYFIALIAVALLMGVSAPLILSVIVGSEFVQGAEIVIYISLGSAFGGMYFMVTNYVFFAGGTGRLALNTLFAGLINVVLTYLLIEKNDMVGAGQSFMISQAILFIGTWRLAHYLFPMPWGKCFSRS